LRHYTLEAEDAWVERLRREKAAAVAAAAEESAALAESEVRALKEAKEAGLAMSIISFWTLDS
jgi:hypothetical protein